MANMTPAEKALWRNGYELGKQDAHDTYYGHGNGYRNPGTQDLRSQGYADGWEDWHASKGY